MPKFQFLCQRCSALVPLEEFAVIELCRECIKAALASPGPSRGVIFTDANVPQSMGHATKLIEGVFRKLN